MCIRDSLYIDGGNTIQRFIAAGSADEITITQIPILISKGIPLFGTLDRDIKLKHIETRLFANGFVQSRYQLLQQTWLLFPADLHKVAFCRLLNSLLQGSSTAVGPWGEKTMTKSTDTKKETKKKPAKTMKEKKAEKKTKKEAKGSLSLSLIHISEPTRPY